MGKEVRGRLKKEGTYVSLWLIHVDVWQIPTWYCRAIILQLKKNKFNYEKSFLFCSTVHAFLCIVLCLSIKVLIFFKCFLFLLMYSLKKIWDSLLTRVIVILFEAACLQKEVIGSASWWSIWLLCLLGLELPVSLIYQMLSLVPTVPIWTFKLIGTV